MEGASVKNLFARLARSEAAQDLAEYGIALAVVAVVVAGAALAIKGDVTTLWTSAQTAIHSAL
jgi:Flp pilus assembly pilin Flp